VEVVGEEQEEIRGSKIKVGKIRGQNRIQQETKR
jgi:hypothetical protein